MLLSLLALIVCGSVRSAIATHVDGFTIDEPYRITAGVSYWRLGDYRLNPEHPPLEKTWVALFLPRGSFMLPALPALGNKVGERQFTSKTVFLRNDPDDVQRRARLRPYVPDGDAAGDLLTRQIERVKKEDPRKVPPLRNPGME